MHKRKQWWRVKVYTIFQVRAWFQKLAPSSKLKRTPPTGAPKAAATPAAAPPDTKSRFSVSVRKYSSTWKREKNLLTYGNTIYLLFLIYIYIGCLLSYEWDHLLSFAIPFSCYVLTFWPGQKCHSKWCTGRKWHIPMAVRRGNRVGRNWLMKWDMVKPMIHS